MSYAAITYLILTALGLGAEIAQHGQPKSPHNVWASIFASVIIMSILYWGGFFS